MHQPSRAQAAFRNVGRWDVQSQLGGMVVRQGVGAGQGVCWERRRWRAICRRTGRRAWIRLKLYGRSRRYPRGEIRVIFPSDSVFSPRRAGANFATWSIATCLVLNIGDLLDGTWRASVLSG